MSWRHELVDTLWTAIAAAILLLIARGVYVLVIGTP
jgi:hypothetical protein